jgi:RHS repeat-associated protein
VNANGFIAARFDFTAFGEKISLGVGLRTIDQGYSAPTNTRQGYGLTETDSTGLDHTWFRKNENRAGRFTSPDPYKGSMSLGSSGSFNRYSYVENQPTNFVDPSGLYWQLQGCQTIWYWETGDFPGGIRYTAIGEICTYSWVNDGPFGGGIDVGGGGGGGGTQSQPQPEKKKKKCKQQKTDAERKAVAEQLGKVAPPGVITNIRDATDANGNKTEGILFDINDPAALKQALKDAGFKTNTIFNADHTTQVGGSIRNTSDNRSDTVGSGNLGPDSNSNGIIRSLQVVIGPTITVGGKKITIGYSDLDCENPAQDVVSGVKHFFRTIF